jgi:hypothetical protein
LGAEFAVKLHEFVRAKFLELQHAVSAAQEE